MARIHGVSDERVAMFFRVKKSQERAYLQIVENRRENGRVKQRVIATLGRLEQLRIPLKTTTDSGVKATTCSRA